MELSRVKLRKQDLSDFDFSFYNSKYATLSFWVPALKALIDSEISEKTNENKVAPPNNFQIGQTVYHEKVYRYREPLKIVGIRENELELEGDYSGGTHCVCQKSWMPIKGVSRIYNHAYKEKCRRHAIAVEILAIPAAGSKDPSFIAMMELADMVMHLTADIELHPEYKNS